MALDLRLAIGLLLVAIGVQLAGYGLAVGVTLDTGWGIGIGAVGAAFVMGARR